MKFYLGTHMVNWLGTLNVPLFVARQRLARVKSLRRATAPYAIDSGAFTELRKHGRWTVPAEVYAREVVAWSAQVGRPDFAAIQDWMCEPFMLERTGRTVAYHQAATVASYLELRELAPSVNWLPVLQGYRLCEYLLHVNAYARAGVDLTKLPLVGLGSVCRRQATGEIRLIATSLHSRGLKLHGFGVKTLGLALYADKLASADSLAWSYDARNGRPLPRCSHRNCANCIHYALLWRARLLQRGTGRGNVD